MLQICRAEDGQVFQVNATLRDIERIGSLEEFLHQESGVPQEAALAYLTDGRRFTNGNLRDLAGAQDQAIFVFNKYYLDYELEDVLQELRVEPLLQPSIEDSISSTPPLRHTQITASYLRTAHLHREFINQTAVTLRWQHDAIKIALSSLDLNVLAISDTFDGIASSSRKDLEKQATLLDGLEADLELIGRVRIHVEFMSNAVRKSIEAGERHRTLGDYVSNVKMKQVAETCARTHDDLRTRFEQAEFAVTKLKEGTDSVRSMVAVTKLLEDSETSAHTAQDVSDKITNAAAALESPTSDPEIILQEMRFLDASLRREVQYIADKKNAYTQQCISALRLISNLNNDLVQIPPNLGVLQASFRGKNSFSHIQRLHNMLYAYGATVIEIVRRKEFSRFFYQRAQSILEVMAKLSASERKRRQVYRGEVHGQLPFETRGMDDPVPSIDFSPSGSSDASYSLEREDVDGLLRVMEDLDQYARSKNDPVALNAVRGCKTTLESLVIKMDSLESNFDKIAERSLLSASRISFSRRRSTEAEELAIQNLSEQLRVTQEAKTHQEALFQEERYALQSEIQGLKTNLRQADVSISGERERTDRLERELHQVRAQMESEATARRILEERNAELLADVESQRIALAQALGDATEHARIAERSKQELAQVRAEFEEVKELESRNRNKVTCLLEEQAVNLRYLEEARGRGEDLETQIKAARAESDEVHQALKEASLDKERLLRLQATEHDRIIRDHIAEADGDRAVLERQFFELRAMHEHAEHQIKDLRADVEVANADAIGLREELQRVEHELRQARHIERILREDVKVGRTSYSDFEQRLEDGNRLLAQVLDVAINFRNSHVKAFGIAQAITLYPGSGAKHTNLAESTLSGLRHSIISHAEEPSPIDPSDPSSALETLRSYDHDHFLEAINKTGSTIRKWQKQCKEYRERAKGKISFRNFAKGDLALFLPTRNSVSKPWAAFNVSFPHYFLQATGHLAEQLKSREWIVARITSITERVVDYQDPTSNPYGLGDGVKYYMLEVEDWTQPSHNRRRGSSKKISANNDLGESAQVAVTNVPKSDSPPPTLPPGPPEAEVEETFRVTHPPNSHLFPVRTRSNSSPAARPSSLSRLLAQATPETFTEQTPPPPPRESNSPSPAASPPHVVAAATMTPSQAVSGPQIPLLLAPSPLRPASRASRLSTTSRFSVGRIPILGSVSTGLPSAAKGAPTIALSEEPIVSSPSSAEGNPFVSPATPSPEGSISDGMTNFLAGRRRTASYHLPRASPLAASQSNGTGAAAISARSALTASSTLANLASSWGVSFGRKKKADLGNLAPTIESPVDEARASHERIAPDAST